LNRIWSSFYRFLGVFSDDTFISRGLNFIRETHFYWSDIKSSPLHCNIHCIWYHSISVSGSYYSNYDLLSYKR